MKQLNYSLYIIKGMKLGIKYKIVMLCLCNNTTRSGTHYIFHLFFKITFISLIVFGLFIVNCQQFITKNGKFNSWFNEMFEKVKILDNEQDSGYEKWLKSNK